MSKSIHQTRREIQAKLSERLAGRFHPHRKTGGISNAERANRASAALASFRNYRNDIEDECELRDLLADLMHYCDQEKVDFWRELRAAQDNYNEER